MTASSPTAAPARAELIARAVRAASVEEVFDAASTRLRRLVPFDAAVWVATDPSTGLPTAPTRLEGMDDFTAAQCRHAWELESLVEDVNLYRDLARAPTPAAALRAATEDHPSRSARYRDQVRPLGFADELRA